MRRRQQEERARAKHDAAVVALLEGRYGKARQFAEEALDVPALAGIAALVAARAALDTRDFATAEAHAHAAGRAGGEPRRAAAHARRRDGARAGAAGRGARDAAGAAQGGGLAHGGAAARAARAAGAPGATPRFPPLVDQLVKRKVYGAAGGRPSCAPRAHARGARRAARNDPAGLRDYWSRLLATPSSGMPKIARAGARRASCALGGDREAAEILARSLERAWEPELVAALCRMPHAGCRRGSSSRPSAGSPRTTRTRRCSTRSGMLCERAQLWGKAQTYLEASLALDDAWRTRVALGELLARARAHRRGERASRRGAQARAGASCARRAELRSLRDARYACRHSDSRGVGEAVGEELVGRQPARFA